MVPSYIESPRPGPTSSQKIWRPRCIMKPVIEPARPSTMIVPPFWSIPVRAPTWPLTIRSPPRIAAPVSEPALDSIVTTPDIMFSQADQPTALKLNHRAVDQAAAKVAETAVEREPAAGEDADAEGMLRAGVEDSHVLHSFLVEQPAQLEIDLARCQALRIEDGSVAVELRDVRDRVVGLDQPARVVGDHALAG